MTSPPPPAPFGKWTLGIVLLMLISAWLAAEAPYLHDFAEWLYQGQILGNLFVHPETVPGFTIVGYPVPNTLATVLLASLGLLLPAVWAGKTFLALLLIAWYVVIGLFVRQHFEERHRDRTTLVLFATAALATFFWYGFVGYQLGLLLLTWFLSLGEDRRTPVTITAFSVALFFSHAMIFLVFGLLLFLTMLQRRDWRVMAALLPAGLLSLWFLAGRRMAQFAPPIADAQWAGWREALLYKLGYPAMMGPFKNFLRPDGSSLFETQTWIYWLGLMTNFAVVLLLCLFALVALWKNRRALWPARAEMASLDNALTSTTLALATLYLLAPYNFFGLINPGGRLILPMLLMAFVIGRADLARLLRVVFWPIAAFTLVTAGGYLYLVTSTPAAAIAEARITQGSNLPANSVFEFNRALYANTRFRYFNYRIFVLAERFEQMAENDYQGLAFHTGVIAQREPDLK
ncbi:hypothetical protein ACFL33_02080 [Pseudomonadota bacterium]